MDSVRTCPMVDMLLAFLWSEDNYLILLQTKQSRQYAYNVTLRRVRLTIVVVEKK